MKIDVLLQVCYFFQLPLLFFMYIYCFSPGTLVFLLQSGHSRNRGLQSVFSRLNKTGKRIKVSRRALAKSVPSVLAPKWKFISAFSSLYEIQEQPT